VELLVVIFLVAIFAALAGPGMVQVVRNNEVRAEASRLVGALNHARSEAVKRNTRVSLCATPDGADCDLSKPIAEGFMVFVDEDGDRAVDAGADEILKFYEPLPGGYTLTNDSGTAAVTGGRTFAGDGSVDLAGPQAVLICSPGGASADAWAVVVNVVGSPRLARGGGTCPG
jgi:type IV fimbrial biogenesis protein FimT